MNLFEKLSDIIYLLKYKFGVKKYYFNDGSERKFILDNYSEFVKNGLNEDDYLKLINNLDENSVKTIQKILERIKISISSDEKKIPLFDLDETMALKHVKHDFIKKIKHRPDGTYSYKNYILPINHFEIGVLYYDYMINFFNDLPALKNRSIIDIGGFIGDSALVFRKYSDAPLYIFEPGKQSYELLQKTLKLNNLTNVVTERYALGDKECMVSISGDGDACASINQSGNDIKQITLDSYVKEHNINVGLIKSDIEGYEKYMLLGAKETILTQKPKLLISIYHNYEQFFGIKPMLEEWGYRKFKVIKSVDGAILIGTVLLCEP